MVGKFHQSQPTPMPSETNNNNNSPSQSTIPLSLLAWTTFKGNNMRDVTAFNTHS